MPSDPPDSLIIGYGSIGRRHESVLRDLGARTATVSRHAANPDEHRYPTLAEALRHFSPSYVVVANRTSEHLDTLLELEQSGFRGTCLVEKPLANHPPARPIEFSFRTQVGYVLRFHPLIQRAHSILARRKLISVQSYVGQYLPDWRPGTDYRTCYSASSSQGGGALRDLSHELDYLFLLAGPWERVAAHGGRFSSLEIDTDDVFGMLIQTERCPIVLCQVNYLDRDTRRYCTVQYDGGTLHLDLIAGRLDHDGDSESVELDRNELFRSMHTAAWASEDQWLCSLPAALDTMELIAGAERASAEGIWVCKASR